MKTKNIKSADSTRSSMLRRMKQDESGVLAFEWILILTILVIGIVAGIATMRDSVSLKMIEAAQVVNSVDSSYEIPKYESSVKDENGSMLYSVEGSKHEEAQVAISLDSKNSSMN